MRMIRNTNEFSSEGSLTTKQSGIGGDAKIVFAILSGMVTDAIEYCVREPSTNAWEANTKKPFELTLPTRWVSTIKFRDFGSGLSHSFMMTRYSKIGESTKDGKDDEVGGWGFGSKSPLAYLMSQEGAGAFTVISRYRGMRSAYVIGINASGKIEITCLAQDPMDETDRGTGLEVSFPVRESDVPRFIDYADRILWGFNPAPVILPADANRPALGRGKVISTGAGWTLYKARGGYDSASTEETLPWSGPHIRIGPVLYPVHLAKLDGMTGFLLPSDCLLIEAPIGSVDVSTSREQLSYTQRTKETLSKLFQDYETSLAADIQEKCEAEPNFFMACKTAKSGCDRLGWDRSKGLFSKISWRGIPVQSLLFADTSSAALVRSTRTIFTEAFKAENLSATSWNPAARIVVEHSSYRSFERLGALGLLANSQPDPTLWIRVKRKDAHLLQSQYGLYPGDYTVMDDIKLPPRDRTSTDENQPKTKIRVRRQVDWNGQQETGPIDLLAGGLYIKDTFSKGRNRSGYGDNSKISLSPYNSNFKEMNQKKFYELMALVKDFGFMDQDRPILIKTDGEELEGDWTSLGDYLQETLEANMDLSQLTPRKSWSKDSFTETLVKLCLGFAHASDDFPSAMLDLMTKTNDLLKRAKIQQEFNEHDRMVDAMNIFMSPVSIPQAADPSSVINEKWQTFIAEHPVLDFILDEIHIGSYGYNSKQEYVKLYKAEESHLKLLQAYIKLAF